MESKVHNYNIGIGAWQNGMTREKISKNLGDLLGNIGPYRSNRGFSQPLPGLLQD